MLFVFHVPLLWVQQDPCFYIGGVVVWIRLPLLTPSV